MKKKENRNIYNILCVVKRSAGKVCHARGIDIRNGEDVATHITMLQGKTDSLMSKAIIQNQCRANGEGLYCIK
jgi:hypothetical protein